MLDRLGRPDPLLDIAMQLEEIALADDYFIERKLYPNVDFYTGLIYKAMGFPTKMFTVLFALGRLPGWIAQWREMIERPGDQDRPPAPGLHRRDRARLRRSGRAGLIPDTAADRPDSAETRRTGAPRQTIRNGWGQVSKRVVGSSPAASLIRSAISVVIGGSASSAYQAASSVSSPSGIGSPET